MARQPWSLDSIALWWCLVQLYIPVATYFYSFLPILSIILFVSDRHGIGDQMRNLLIRIVENRPENVVDFMAD